jgi:signal transduction histidine kinase
MKIYGKFLSHDKFLSNYCSLIMEKLPGVCDPEFDGEQGIHMCGAGLWCITVPIKRNNDAIAYLSIGHKRLGGDKDLETKAKLYDLFKSGKINEDNYHMLEGYLDNIEISSLDKYEDVIRRYVPAITNYLLSEKQHEDRIRELKTLSTYLAHSFLSPIQAIVARAENLLIAINQIDQEYIDIELIENCRSIIEEVTKLSNSAENLRDWMADEKDIYNISPNQNVFIYKSIREAIDLFRSEASFRGIIIDEPRTRGMPFPYIKGSIPHLRKAFVNLINNAVKYSFDGYPGWKRHIEIYCEPVYRLSRRYYCIHITNYGVGILPDEKEMVFEYGYRGKLAKDRNRFGSGLGLAAVKRIIEAHNGSVSLDSEIVERTHDGSNLNIFKTTINVYLPLGDEK